MTDKVFKIFSIIIILLSIGILSSFITNPIGFIAADAGDKGLMTRHSLLNIIGIEPPIDSPLYSQNNSPSESEYIFIPSTPTIPAATPTPIYVPPKDPTYTKMWYQCSISIWVYNYNDEYITNSQETITDTIPYSKHDWSDSMTPEEVYDIMFYGIPYNYIETEYDETEYYDNDKAVGKLKFIIYGDDCYIKVGIYTTMTRY